MANVRLLSTLYNMCTFVALCERVTAANFTRLIESVAVIKYF